MPDLLRQAAQWLADTRTRHASEEVTYQRASASVCVSATRGRTEFETDDGTGYPVAHVAADFIVRTADLEIDGEQVTPLEGDRIIVGEPDEGTVFEVMRIPGQQAWRYADQHEIEIRIHTKKIGTQPPQP